MVYRPLTQGILTTTHCILTPLSITYWPPTHDMLPHPIHGILTPPTYCISNSLLSYYEPLSFGKKRGDQFTMRGFNIQWQKIIPGVNISYTNWNRGQKTMGIKIPYDIVFTMITVMPKFKILSIFNLWCLMTIILDKCVYVCVWASVQPIRTQSKSNQIPCTYVFEIPLSMCLLFFKTH